MTVGLLTVLLAEFALKLQNTEPSTVANLQRQVQHQQFEVLPSSARSDGVVWTAYRLSVSPVARKVFAQEAVGPCSAAIIYCGHNT